LSLELLPQDFLFAGRRRGRLGETRGEE